MIGLISWFSFKQHFPVQVINNISNIICSVLKKKNKKQGEDFYYYFIFKFLVFAGESL